MERDKDEKVHKLPQLMELLQYIKLLLAVADWNYANLCVFFSPDNTSQYKLKHTLYAGKKTKRISLSECDQTRL